jgi:hypothetical protein
MLLNILRTRAALFMLGQNQHHPAKLCTMDCRLDILFQMARGLPFRQTFISGELSKCQADQATLNNQREGWHE